MLPCRLRLAAGLPRRRFFPGTGFSCHVFRPLPETSCTVAPGHAARRWKIIWKFRGRTAYFERGFPYNFLSNEIPEIISYFSYVFFSSTGMSRPAAVLDRATAEYRFVSWPRVLSPVRLATKMYGMRGLEARYFSPRWSAAMGSVLSWVRLGVRFVTVGRGVFGSVNGRVFEARFDYGICVWVIM